MSAWFLVNDSYVFYISVLLVIGEGRYMYVVGKVL